MEIFKPRPLYLPELTPVFHSIESLLERQELWNSLHLLQIEHLIEPISSHFIKISSHVISVMYICRSLSPGGKTLNITIEVSIITYARLSPVLERYIKFHLNCFQGTHCLTHRHWKTKATGNNFGKVVTSQPASKVSSSSVTIYIC